MDDIIRLVAIIVIIGAGAASSIVKNLNKNKDDEINTTPIEPPKSVPSRPPARPPQQRSKPIATTDGHSLEGQSLETRPQRRRQPIQRRQPQPAAAQRQRTSKAPMSDQVYVEPLPQSNEKKDLVTEIFKAFMEVEEPEIVMEPAPPKPKPRAKPAQKAIPKQARPAPQQQMTPARLAELANPTKPYHPLFSQLAKQAEVNPLRVAVVLSEILKRPRSLPPLARWSDHQ